MKVPINNGNIKITSNYGNRQYYYKGKLARTVLINEKKWKYY